MDLNGARVGRYDVVECMYKDGFEEVMIGMCLRIPLSQGRLAPGFSFRPG